MARKFVALLFLCLVATASFASCAKDRREIIPPPNVMTSAPAAPAPAEPPPAPVADDDPATREVRATMHAELVSKIDEAKRLLRPAPMRTRRIGGNDAVLAVWNPATKSAIALVTVAGGVSKTRGFDVTVRQCNGVNSHYRVNSPEGYVTLAIKTNVRGAHAPHASTAVVYVPYSEALRTPEVIASGREYLLDLVERASDRLDDADVRSLLDPERKVTETVPSKILATLLVVEHVDPDEFDQKGVDHAVGKVLTMLGTNRGDSFRYAVSYANARGIAQFIEPTYRLTRERYPRARLPASFVEGMTDHESAVMAQFCLADWSETKLPPKLLRKLNASDRQEDLGAYLAAAYNGGENAASSAIIADPANWEKAGHGLYDQTVKYIVIFRAVYKKLYP